MPSSLEIVFQPLLHRLKEETKVCHEALERGLNLSHPDFDVVALQRLLTRFYGFYAAWEPQVTAVIEHKLPEFYTPRKKLGLLAADLSALGCDTQAQTRLPIALGLPNYSSFSSALGSLYVMEGSTLGGKFIARHIETTLPLQREKGYSYFLSYGDQVGSMWKETKAVLEAHSNPGQHDNEIVHSAIATFEYLRFWLAREERG
jgi:heme oxygenase